jgi:hypothetical protein
MCFLNISHGKGFVNPKIPAIIFLDRTGRQHYFTPGIYTVENLRAIANRPSSIMMLGRPVRRFEWI